VHAPPARCSTRGCPSAQMPALALTTPPPPPLWATLALGAEWSRGWEPVRRTHCCRPSSLLYLFWLLMKMTLNPSSPPQAQGPQGTSPVTSGPVPTLRFVGSDEASLGNGSGLPAQTCPFLAITGCPSHVLPGHGHPWPRVAGGPGSRERHRDACAGPGRLVLRAWCSPGAGGLKVQKGEETGCPGQAQPHLSAPEKPQGHGAHVSTPIYTVFTRAHTTHDQDKGHPSAPTPQSPTVRTGESVIKP